MLNSAVLGPGGVGGFLAAALERSGVPVTVVARESTAALIAREGIAVRSMRLGDFGSRPPAVARLETPVDVLFVATKATGLADAVERVAARPRLVVPLLNGLDHVSWLRERFGPDRVVAATIRVEADRPAPGQVLQTSPFLRVDLAADDPELHRSLAPVAELLERAEVPAQIQPSEADALWGKLVRLNALALTTSASELPLGAIREDPGWRTALEEVVREGAAVARAEGADLDAAQPLAELESAHASLGSSMQRDIAAGRAPELDAIAGAVLRAGARHAIACPTTARLVAEVAARAPGGG